MNIVEAIKSGHSFGRLGDDKIYVNEEIEYCFTRKELLSNNWEVHPEKRELSWEEIEDVLSGYAQKGAPFIPLMNLPLIKKELGFK